jgi:hypothetical protein
VSGRFCDSVSHYGTDQLLGKWSSAAGAVVSVGQILLETLSGSYVAKVLDGQPTWIMGCEVKAQTFGANALPLMTVLDGGGVQMCLRLNGDGTLSVTDEAGTVYGTTPLLNALYANTAYYVEWLITLHNAEGGSYIVAINGTTVLEDAGRNTDPLGTDQADTVVFGSPLESLNTHANVTYKHLYVCDGTGAAPTNTLLGRCHVDCTYPDADGDAQDWVPSVAGSHYSQVNESAPDDDAGYVSDQISGHRERMTIAPLSPSRPLETLYFAQVCLWAKKTDSEDRAITPLLSHGLAVDLADPVDLAEDYTYALGIFHDDPLTNAPWADEGTFNQAQIGMETT